MNLFCIQKTKYFEDSHDEYVESVILVTSPISITIEQFNSLCSEYRWRKDNRYIENSGETIAYILQQEYGFTIVPYFKY